ncbi:Glucanosyltransferase-domain-containing protein [Dipodascopsis tothii]|uniref:Glucanosyltransferase-domain-containing protein n=1 Tax=Dipodascopsis tothii TaxID=44089 RepID=UPI0034CDB518
MKYASALLAAGLFASSAAATLSPIVTYGNAFFDSKTGDRFYIRGVDYQPPNEAGETIDPLADSDVCGRDIPVLEALGINTIRVYNVDNSADHSDCMKQLDDAGIYLVLDVSTADQAISREYPEYSYNEVLLQHVFATVDAFSDYTNVLAFFAGNEVINSVNNTNAATIVKAVIRDMREYISKQASRTIPVGYSAADVSENRYQMAHYLNCGSDAGARADFFAFNDYSWCGDSSYTVSGYNEKVANFANYSIPLFFSEYGCNLVQPRTFTEVESIYSEKMLSVFSGGMVYEYSEDTNNYGLVSVNYDNSSVTERSDYTYLQAEYKKTANPSGNGTFSADNDISDCPAYVKGSWEANNTLPALPSKASSYMTAGAGTPLGSDGPSNQWTPDETTVDTSALYTATSTAEAESTADGSATATASATETMWVVPSLAVLVSFLMAGAVGF